MRRHHGIVSFLFLTLLVCLALLSANTLVLAQTPTDDPNNPDPSPSVDPEPSTSVTPEPSPSSEPSPSPPVGPPSPSPSHHPKPPSGAGALGTLAAPAGPVPTKSHITVGFKDAAGTQIGASSYAIHTECLPLDTTSIPQGVVYAFGGTSDLHAALNLYQDPRCQVAVSSAVGYWPNTGVTADVASIRFEGKAPASMPPGTLSPNVFPPGMQVQTPVPSPTEDVWVMDPSKGKLLVGLVAAVLGVGVAIGVYQVYQAAQYVAPPKVPKKKGNGLNNKKVKRQDAYFMKPGYEPVSLDADAADTPGGHARDSSKTSSRELLMGGTNKFKQTPHQLEMQQKYRLSMAKSLNSQYDMAGTTGSHSPLAPVSNSSTSSGRTLNRNNQNTTSAGLEGPSAIMMQERLQKQQDNRFSTGGMSVASSGTTFPAPPMTPPSFSSAQTTGLFGTSAPSSSAPAAAVASAALSSGGGGGKKMGSNGAYSSPYAPPPLPNASRPRVDDTPMLIVEDDIILPPMTSNPRAMTTPTTRSSPSELVNLIDYRDRSANSSPRPIVPPKSSGGYVPRTQYSASPPPTPNHTRPISGSQFQYPSQHHQQQQQQQQQQPQYQQQQYQPQQRQQQQQPPARYGNNTYVPMQPVGRLPAPPPPRPQ